MKKQLLILAGIIFLLGSYGLKSEAGKKSSSTDTPFAFVNVHFEQNATDGDIEVVFEATGGDAGLAMLNVVSPDGRTVVDFTAKDPSTMGIRSFRFESPEPKDVEGLKAAYPQGAYTFTGATSAGDKFHGKSTLNHKLPATVSFKYPAEEAEDVPLKNVKISWGPVANLAAYLIALEQEGSDVNITAKLPGTATSFAVPDGFLQPGTEYKLGIGTVTEGGNMSMVETSFTTAGEGNE